VDLSKILPWLALVFGFSGWFKVFLDYLSNKPKIAGQIINVFRGRADLGGGIATTFVTYPYIHNLRKNSMHILDYRLRVEIEGVWIGVERVYGIENAPSFTFETIGGDPVEVPEFSKKLIYKKDAPVQHGVPLHGWLVFAGKIELYEKRITSYELTCIDVNKVEHTIRTKTDHMNDLLMVQFAEIRNAHILRR